MSSNSLQELRDALFALSADSAYLFIEVRGKTIELRTPLVDLVCLVRSLEEQVMWLTLEKDRIAASAEDTKALAKEKTKAAGLEIARLKAELRRFSVYAEE